jgi:hypothetical protein
MIGKEVMEGLKERIGEEVTVVYVCYGEEIHLQGVLKAVNDFVNIEIAGKATIPFVGYGCAIRKIFGEDGKLLYSNPLIPPDYDVRDFKIIYKIVTLSFGEEIAKNFAKEREETRKWILNLIMGNKYEM